MAAVDIETDWLIVSHDWWRTSFRSISWTWPPRTQSKSKEREESPTSHPRPPHYHDLLHRTRRWVRLEIPEAHVQEIELNSELAGVQAAEEVIRQYELDVCIRSLVDLEEPLFPAKVRAPLFIDDKQEESRTLGKEKWDHQVRELFGSDALNRLAAASSASHTSTPTSPELDLTDSELSVESDPLPATPKVSKKSYAHAVHNDDADATHGVFAPLPSKPLNASALSFTPGAQPPAMGASPPLSASSSSSPANGSSSRKASPPQEFTFPTLNPPLSDSPAPRGNARSLPPPLTKDEHGFYIVSPPPPPASSNSNSRPSSGRLPAFLAAPRPRHTSKTRELVDRLRKSSRPRGKRGEPRRSSTLPEDTEAAEAAAQEAERKSVLLTEIDGWITSVTSTSAANDEGWIAPAPAPAPAASRSGRGHKRAASSVSSQLSQASALLPTNPLVSHGPAVVPVYYPYAYAYPQYAAPVYVQPTAAWGAPATAYGPYVGRVR
ncbi:hypothetical protein CERSUDRAFT_118271 [Gelatoporia subvermispora B]|uniref:Uncharacterized protein n=1 Tax=Ceriporiopsis subvermispora (strain B) TaxID=914234 RepID=M2QM33_CERS8|nr:hypothetical protein CERSUDRAFT_118271 [Gelatoporia subvermispora B]